MSQNVSPLCRSGGAGKLGSLFNAVTYVVVHLIYWSSSFKGPCFSTIVGFYSPPVGLAPLYGVR